MKPILASLAIAFASCTHETEPPRAIPAPIQSAAVTPVVDEAGTMLAAAEAAIEAMPDGEEKTVVKAAWDNNANFQRSSPTIQAFAAQLGLSSTDLDHLFEKAISFSV